MGAFAQMPHLPKMLNVRAIHETLVRGCEDVSFVLRLPRPNRTFRTWWRTRPDEVSLKDPAMELVLPEKAELSDIPVDQLAKGRLPELWKADSIRLGDLHKYFAGATTVQVDRGTHHEAVVIPKVTHPAVDAAVKEAVAGGMLWLLSGPASILSEPVPDGILSEDAELRMPPAAILATQILPQALPEAWKGYTTTAIAIATQLSHKLGVTLPWATVRDAVGSALQARFLELAKDSLPWPCDFSGAASIGLVISKTTDGGSSGDVGGEIHENPGVFIADADLAPNEVQDLGEAIPKLLALAAATDTPLRFRVRIEVGALMQPADKAVVAKLNAELKKIDPKMELR